MFIDKRILYVKESVGVLMVLKGFKNKSNKPYRSSLAHELRFTTYRVDIILFLCNPIKLIMHVSPMSSHFERIKGKAP